MCSLVLNIIICCCWNLLHSCKRMSLAQRYLQNQIRYPIGVLTSTQVSGLCFHCHVMMFSLNWVACAWYPGTLMNHPQRYLPDIVNCHLVCYVVHTCVWSYYIWHDILFSFGLPQSTNCRRDIVGRIQTVVW